MFWVGLLVRLLYITIARSYHFRALEDHFQFGWEAGRVARAVVQGRGYSDPFGTGSGPTAWLAPLYPLIIAASFKLFGIYTPAAAWVLLALNSACCALVAPAIYEIAIRCYGSDKKGLSIARWSGWLWALYPAAMQYAVRWIWEMSLTVMLFAWVLVFVLRICDEQLPRKKLIDWCVFGSLWGLICLNNPALMLFFPVCILWLLWHTKSRATAIVQAILACIVFTACISPWVWRNWVVFHQLIPTRGNLGAEVYEGNGPGSNGFPWGATIPIDNRNPDMIEYKRIGEFQYVQKRGRMANAYIATHRRHFAEISLKRFYFFWVSVPHPTDKHPFFEYVREFDYCFLSISGLLGLGLSLKRRIPAAGLFAWAFLLLPLSYYFVTPGARFRHPLEPLIDIFSVFLFQSAVRSRQTTVRSPS
jgi:4-amino-4-deoxy-L-arabinose transferase-like glycosyltransferase